MVTALALNDEIKADVVSITNLLVAIKMDKTQTRIMDKNNISTVWCDNIYELQQILQFQFN